MAHPKDLTDADMSITNDWPQAISVIVGNNDNMDDTFPSPANIASGSIATGYVSASSFPGQSSFAVTFSAGDKMTVDIGTGFYNTGTKPESFPDGKAGAILAPGTPFSTGVDFNFQFFDGPGILPALINSAIQANLPALVAFIDAHGLIIKISDTNVLKITQLQIDPSAVVCTYAAGLSVPNSSIWNVNAIFNIAKGTIVGSETITNETGNINLSVSDCFIYLQAQVDTSLQTDPKVTALQCSFGDFSLSGTIITVLEALFPLFAELIKLGLTPYRAGGAINTDFNATIISAINSAISAAFHSTKSSDGLLEGPANSLGLDKSIIRPATLSRSPKNIDLAKWMSAPQIQALPLGQLKLPGTHDSATYGLTDVLSQISYDDIALLWALSNQSAPANGNPPIPAKPSPDDPIYLGPELYDFVIGTAVNSVSRTQDMNILQQLQSGIRYFDFRVYFDSRDNTFYTQHALRGPAFSDILSQIQTFITANPSSGELIFAYISHTNLKGYPEQVPALAKLVNSYIAPGNIYFQPTPAGGSSFDFQSLAGTTVRAITAGAPKVMFLNGDYAQFTFADTITNTGGYASLESKNERYTVSEMASQEGQALQANTLPLWQVSWSLGADTATIVQNILVLLTGVNQWCLQDIATGANAALAGFLGQYGGASGKFNLVTVDWLELGGTTSVPELIVGMN
ncbi:PLC-like phosphodiesterase [Lasiosphaeria miniovina]|uniref:PLC-like phosphodiesterase n=1 Tax=Lasiosphaeria miniovina TaxID=1954250 RepID=A0AA40AMC2_9PEZI|nr:PLC-like phosphodiesterase [Lasiosphaeria miniovina]KAK0718434.1 PLC-like phosphodiesterase [Lasiosphaeria miniovina]